MACAKPVIGCSGQGIAEIIRHRENGWLVARGVSDEGGDATQLIAALRELLGDANLRTRIGAAARQTVLQGFTVLHQAEGLAAIYGEVCRAAEPSP